MKTLLMYLHFLSIIFYLTFHIEIITFADYFHNFPKTDSNNHFKK